MELSLARMISGDFFFSLYLRRIGKRGKGAALIGPNRC